MIAKLLLVGFGGQESLTIQLEERYAPRGESEAQRFLRHRFYDPGIVQQLESRADELTRPFSRVGQGFQFDGAVRIKVVSLAQGVQDSTDVIAINRRCRLAIESDAQRELLVPHQNAQTCPDRVDLLPTVGEVE